MRKTVFSKKVVSENTWMITGGGCTCYLLIGENEAVAIDTGYAKENIQQYMQALTDKPVKRCLNTHGHFSHTGGNGYFERTYMTSHALMAATVPYEECNPEDYCLRYPITILVDKDIIDLGGRKLEVIEIPAHSIGSVAYLDKKNKMLFTGDEVGEVSLIWKDKRQPYVEDFAANMERLMQIEKWFQTILTGHGNQAYSKKILYDSYENGKKIIQETAEWDVLTDDDMNAIGHYIPEIQYKRKSVYGQSMILFDKRFIKREKKRKV